MIIVTIHNHRQPRTTTHKNLSASHIHLHHHSTSNNLYVITTTHGKEKKIKPSPTLLQPPTQPTTTTTTTTKPPPTQPTNRHFNHKPRSQPNPQKKKSNTKKPMPRRTKNTSQKKKNKNISETHKPSNPKPMNTYRRINPVSMLPTLSTSSPCFSFRLRFDLIALPVHLSFSLGLLAWVGELGRRKGWVGA